MLTNENEMLFSIFNANSTLKEKNYFAYLSHYTYFIDK